jgi:hypothetical protein
VTSTPCGSEKSKKRKLNKEEKRVEKVCIKMGRKAAPLQDDRRLLRGEEAEPLLQRDALPREFVVGREAGGVGRGSGGVIGGVHLLRGGGRGRREKRGGGKGG